MKKRVDEISTYFKERYDDNVLCKPNYTKLKIVQKLLDTMELAMPHGAFILDLFKRNIYYISKSSLLLCGYSREEAIDLGFDFYYKILPEEYVPRFRELNYAAIRFFNDLSVEDKMNGYMSVDLILNHKNGGTISVSRRLKPYLLSETGQVVMALCTSSYSYSKTMSNAFVILNYSKRLFKYCYDRKKWEELPYVELTDKERDVFILCYLGKTSKEIAEELGLSVYTISYYKKNIIKKSGCSSIKEAIMFFQNIAVI